MDCERYSDYLVDYVFGETDPAQSASIESHLSSCRACTREVRDIRKTVDTLREADGIVNRVSPDPHFRNRVVQKIRQRRRDSVILVRRHSSRRAPLIAAMTAAAVLLAVIVYILTYTSSYFEPGDDSERWSQVPGVENSPVKPHPVDSTTQRPGQNLTQPRHAQAQSSKEADQMGSEDAEIVEETEMEPAGPVPAPSPDVRSEHPEDMEPIPVPGEPFPELATAPEEIPLKEWVAQLYSVRGEVQLKRSGTDKWLRGSEDDKVFKGDSIKTAFRGGGVVFLSAGGSVVLNRSTVLGFSSHTRCALEKGEVLACSYRRPLVLTSGDLRVNLSRSDAYIQRKTRETRIVAVNGMVNVERAGEVSRIASGSGAVFSGDGKVEALQKINLAREIEWVCDAARKFKLWIEGECCRHFGYFILQQRSRNLSNFASIHKIGTSASLSWRLKLPHTMPCYIWVRYARSDREPEKIRLMLNCQDIEEKTIKAAGARWFWVKAFKVTLGRRNDIRLSFTSNKHVKSSIDLVLVTNDPDFNPPRDIPKGGYYGKK